MCSECRCEKCPPRCPNAPEVEPLITCDRQTACINTEISEGEAYLDDGTDRICMVCAGDLTVRDLSELAGMGYEEILEAVGLTVERA